MARLKFMNTEIDNLTMQETLQAIDSIIQENRNAYVVTPNVDHIVQLETNKELQDVYANASLILTDGKPLLWIAKWYGTPIKEKISGSDLFPLLCDMAAKKGYKMYFDSYTNQQYPILSKKDREKLAQKYQFSFWEQIDEDYAAVRFCTSWATSEEAIDELIQDI